MNRANENWSLSLQIIYFNDTNKIKIKFTLLNKSYPFTHLYMTKRFVKP